jgi:hypothetical protein
MRKIYLLLMLLFALQVQGQYYSPFRPGVPAQYTTVAGDTTTLLQLSRNTQYVPGIGSVLSRDSLYSFVPRAKARLPNVGGCHFGRFGGGLFGEVMGANFPRSYRATYSLCGNYNATYDDYDVELLLKPYAPLNQAWNATHQQTAQVVSRTVQPVLGVPDSVVTIAFSGGQQLRLSKYHGLIDGPALAHFAGNRPARRFTLTALPRQHLGQPVLGTLAIYNFQPGDRLVYEYDYGQVTSSTRINYLYSDSILNRSNSRTGDTVTYRILRFSQQGNSTTAYTDQYTATSGPLGTQPSQHYVPANQGLSQWMFLPDAVRSSVYPTGRPVQRTINVSLCIGAVYADTLGVNKLNVDVNSGADYAAGLGHVRIHSINVLNGNEIITTTLVGYRKGTEKWGSLPRMRFAPLGGAASHPAATTAVFPNPFGAELAVVFTLATPQPVALTLHDALGRVVLKQTTRPFPAGARQLTLPTAGLPVGVYSLHLHFAQEGRTEVVKVFKN